MNGKRAFRLLYIGWLTTATALGLAIAGRQSAQFYSVLRWICSTVFACSAIALVYCAANVYHTCRERDGRAVLVPVIFHLVIVSVVGALAVLFNPLSEFHHARQTWLLFDKLSLGLILFLCWGFYHKLMLPGIWAALIKQLALLVAGLVAAVLLLTEGIHVIKIMGAKAMTDGRVVDIDYESVESDYRGSGDVRIGIYEFTVRGKKFYGHARNYDEVGQTVPVLYNLQNPSENRARGESERVGTFLVLLLVGGYFSCWAITSACRNLLNLLKPQARK
jgi:hypothetical protein